MTMKVERKAPRRKGGNVKPQAAASHSRIVAALLPLGTPIDQLKPDPKNARRHGEDNLRAIRASLERFGQRRPVVANRTSGEIEAGHGIFEAAGQLGWTEIAVVWVEDDPAAQRGFALADNRTAELAEWDDSLLQELLESLQEETPDLVSDLAWEDLLARPAEQEAAKTEAVPSQWHVVIECRDQGEQQQVYEECCAAGRTCRVLTM